MKNEIKTIEDIFNSDLFIELMGNDEKEIKESGWNYNDLIQFGNELAKLIEKK